MKQFFLTDQGKVRKQNEDAVGLFKNQAEQTLVLVADGMGGHKAGDVASKMVRSFFLEEWEESEEISSPEAAEDWLDQRIRMANQEVYNYAKDNPDCYGMGTTVVAAVFLDNNISIAHIGDSRCYLLEDTIKQVTEDHTLVNELVRTGEITKEEAHVHPQKNVLMKALGTDKVISPEVFSIQWTRNNRILICTDGLSDKVQDKEIESFLVQEQSIEEIAEQLVNRANNLGGEDNITVVIVENVSGEDGDSSC